MNLKTISVLFERSRSLDPSASPRQTLHSNAETRPLERQPPCRKLSLRLSRYSRRTQSLYTPVSYLPLLAHELRMKASKPIAASSSCCLW